MINKSLSLQKNNSEAFLMSLCYKSVLNQLIFQCLDTSNHINYHVQLPTKFKRLLLDVVRSSIACQIIQNEHYIDVMCDVLAKETILSYGKIEAILYVLHDLFDKIELFLQKQISKN